MAQEQVDNRFDQRDERLDIIMSYLWGTWDIDSLERKIAKLFPGSDPYTLKRVTRRIMNYHCDGNGYTDVQIQRQLSRL